MLFQFCHQSRNLQLLKLSIISTQDTQLKLQVLNRVLNNQSLLSLLALVKPFCLSNLKYMLIYWLKKYSNTELMFGLSTLVGQEENMALERESAFKQLETLLIQSTMVHLQRPNSRHYQHSTFNSQNNFLM